MAATGSLHEEKQVEIVNSAGSRQVHVSKADASTDSHQHTQSSSSVAEKRLLRKLDFRILPCLWPLFLMAHLQGANIGNAKTGGLQHDFDLTSTQYSLIIIMFYISFIVFEIPANVFLARSAPRYLIPGYCFCWGVTGLLLGVTKNWKQIAGLKFLQGLFSGGFPPGCIFYVSTWYKKHENATRYGLLSTAQPVAGMVSGLLAGLITQHMEGAGGVRGWRWILILEGLASIVVAVLVFPFLPNFPSTSKHFLNEAEGDLACTRLVLEGTDLARHKDSEKVPSMTAFRQAVSDYKTWSICLLFMLVSGSETMRYFIPTLVNSFGWTGYSGQYHTIPIYASSLLCIVATCLLADRFRKKWPFIIIVSALGCALFVALTTTTNKTARYVLTTLAFPMIEACHQLVKTWTAEIIPRPVQKRAIAIALINSLGNSANIYGIWLWPQEDAPLYTKGFGVTTSWLGLLCGLTVAFTVVLKKHE